MAEGVTVGQLRRMLETEEKYERLSKAAKAAKEDADSAMLEVHEAMEGAKQKSTEQDLGEPWGVFYFRPDATVYTHVYDEDAYRAWVKEQNRERELIAEPAPRKQPLNQFVRRALKTPGMEMPPGVEQRRTRYVQHKRKPPK